MEKITIASCELEINLLKGIETELSATYDFAIRAYIARCDELKGHNRKEYEIVVDKVAEMRNWVAMLRIKCERRLEKLEELQGE